MSSLQQNWRKVQNRFCLEVRGVGGRRWWWGAGGRNDPNKVCAYEYMNKEEKNQELKTNYFNIVEGVNFFKVYYVLL
jgi:hypothetical protein